MADREAQVEGTEAAEIVDAITPISKAQYTVDYQDRTYQIDPGRKKVYRRFVEIETSKASEILSTWRAQHSAA